MKKLIVISASLAVLAAAAWLLRSPPAGEASNAGAPSPQSLSLLCRRLLIGASPQSLLLP
jgi:hypothetical protein